MTQALIEADFARAAAALGCDVPSIKAVCQVEAPKGGFLPDGQVTILFERHIFHRLTNGRFGISDISNPQGGGYGAAGQHQHDKLARAVKLDRDAALKSCSWGKFQIMGFNHAAAGHPTLQGFINAMHESEGAQLDAFVAFIRNDPRMHKALRERNWSEFARRYNGPAYAEHGYHTRLAAAYEREVRG